MYEWALLFIGRYGKLDDITGAVASWKIWMDGQNQRRGASAYVIEAETGKFYLYVPIHGEGIAGCGVRFSTGPL